jgi:hypothetical protein
MENVECGCFGGKTTMLLTREECRSSSVKSDVADEYSAVAQDMRVMSHALE